MSNFSGKELGGTVHIPLKADTKKQPLPVHATQDSRQKGLYNEQSLPGWTQDLAQSGWVQANDLKLGSGPSSLVDSRFL